MCRKCVDSICCLGRATTCDRPKYSQSLGKASHLLISASAGWGQQNECLRSRRFVYLQFNQQERRPHSGNLSLVSYKIIPKGKSNCWADISQWYWLASVPCFLIRSCSIHEKLHAIALSGKQQKFIPALSLLRLKDTNAVITDNCTSTKSIYYRQNILKLMPDRHRLW